MDSTASLRHSVGMLRIFAALTLIVTLAGCSSTGSHAGAAVAVKTPATRTAMPRPSASSPAASVSGCVFTVAQVSNVLDGAWSRGERGSHGCVYSSDRGAVFATVDIGLSEGQGLREARQACIAGVSPVKTGRTGFVCVEAHANGDVVSGNFIAGGHLWLAVATVPSGTSPTPQLTAMIALLSHLAY